VSGLEAVLHPPLLDYSDLRVTVILIFTSQLISPVSLDWHATVETAEVLGTFAGYHPSLLAVVK